MPYTDFDLETIRHQFAVTIQTDSLFPQAQTRPVPLWLQQTLTKGMPLALVSEKSRSEFIIAPVLLTVRDLVHEQIAIYSGQRFDGDASMGLVGECDFILTPTPAVPIVQAPIISIIVEAKKNDIEAGLGQCAAQMLGAQRFNLREQTGITTIHGCVTTGEAWQFMKLAAETLSINIERYYIIEVGIILDVFVSIVTPYILGE